MEWGYIFFQSSFQSPQRSGTSCLPRPSSISSSPRVKLGLWPGTLQEDRLTLMVAVGRMEPYTQKVSGSEGRAGVSYQCCQPLLARQKSPHPDYTPSLPELLQSAESDVLTAWSAAKNSDVIAGYLVPSLPTKKQGLEGEPENETESWQVCSKRMPMGWPRSQALSSLGTRLAMVWLDVIALAKQKSALVALRLTCSEMVQLFSLHTVHNHYSLPTLCTSMVPQSPLLPAAFPVLGRAQSSPTITIVTFIPSDLALSRAMPKLSRSPV